MIVNNINLKILKMNNIIIILVLAISIASCKAQIIAVEDYKAYTQELEEGAYIKDINNVLDKFVGTWKGTYNNKNYEFIITKNTENFKYRPSIREDLLLMRYKITESSGSVIEDTLSLPNDSSFVMQNGYVAQTGSYVFSYIGREVACGQNGSTFMKILNNTNNLKAKLFLSLSAFINNPIDINALYSECVTRYFLYFEYVGSLSSEINIFLYNGFFTFIRLLFRSRLLSSFKLNDSKSIKSVSAIPNLWRPRDGKSFEISRPAGDALSVKMRFVKTCGI